MSVCDACGSSAGVKAIWRCMSIKSRTYIELCNHHLVVNQDRLEEQQFEIVAIDMSFVEDLVV